MRASVFVLALSLAAGPATAAPQRVASLNLCTDELLLLLGDPKQIASVTHLAQNPAETPLWRQARRFPRNDGSLASVAGLRPDLVLTMGGGARDRAGIARRLGIRLLDLPYPQNLVDVAAELRTVAGALGHADAAKPWLIAMASLQHTAPPPHLDTIWLGGGGRTVAAGSLAAQWMGLAGLRQRPLVGDRLSLEELLAWPPALILRSDYRAGQYSNDQRWLSHPLVARTHGSRTVATDGRLWTCMGPLLAPEILRLRKGLGR
ncbi:MAG TPA: ABC transporter substrate-binding protein [Allosphingosinicella sp.]|jgi:iron complex transport system substrate-binding protein|nr:ABC transporter substrate-binding protein [Allosphingosinicella sp.]